MEFSGYEMEGSVAFWHDNAHGLAIIHDVLPEGNKRSQVYHLVVFGAVGYPLASGMLVHFLEI